MTERIKSRFKRLLSPEGYSDRLQLPPGYGGPSQIIITGKEMVQVDGCESLVSYADDHITLSLTDRTVTVYGNELSMKTFCQGQVAICGKIRGVMEGDCKEEDENAHH